jgi:hypothetical protein
MEEASPGEKYAPACTIEFAGKKRRFSTAAGPGSLKFTIRDGKLKGG